MIGVLSWILSYFPFAYTIGLLPFFHYFEIIQLNGDFSTINPNMIKIFLILIILAAASKLIVENLQLFFTIIFFIILTLAMISYCNSQEHKCVMDYKQAISSSIGFVVSNITEK